MRLRAERLKWARQRGEQPKAMVSMAGTSSGGND